AEKLDVNGNVRALKFIGDGSLLTNLPSGAGGTITGVTPGLGLAGGGTSGTVTLGIASAGVTNAMLQNASVTMNAGQRLSGGGILALGETNTLNVDFNATQRRVGGACAMGNAIRTVNADGSVACEPVVGGLGGGGTQDALAKFLPGGVTVGSSRVLDNGTTVTLGDDTLGRFSLIGSASSPSTVAGFKDNSATGPAGGPPIGETIAGGGASGNPNQVTFPYGTVSGGLGNVASGTAASIPGGLNNVASGDFSFAAGSQSK